MQRRKFIGSSIIGSIVCILYPSKIFGFVSSEPKHEVGFPAKLSRDHISIHFVRSDRMKAKIGPFRRSRQIPGGMVTTPERQQFEDEFEELIRYKNYWRLVKRSRLVDGDRVWWLVEYVRLI